MEDMSIGFGDAEVNILNLCRLCLQKDTYLTPIFRSCDTTNELALKIVSCLPVKISINDKIKSKICGECLFKVETFYEFWLRTSESQKQLENWLNANDQNVEIESQFQASTLLTPQDIEEEKEKLSSINSDRGCGIINDNKNVEEDDDLFDILTHLGNICSSDDELIEPTTFVNVAPEPDEPGPSGIISNSPSSSSCLPDSPKGEETVDYYKVEKHKDNFIKHKCKHCSEEFDSLRSLKLHQKKHLICKCNICGKRFLSNDKLNSHMGSHKKRYQCPSCPYSNLSASNYKIHLMKHKKEFLITCSACGKGFYNFSYFRNHKMEKHSNEITVYKCDTCNKAYNSKSYLQRHIKTHSSSFVPVNYQCEICGKIFQSWKGTKRHIKTVHEGRRYKCDICDKVVNCLQSLKNHKKIHSGEKNYICDKCGKGFITQHSLSIHERTHTGEKPYKCGICDKSFSQPSTLKVHKRYHTGERPYQCKFCSKRFVTCSLSLAHEKAHHDGSKGSVEEG